MDSKGRITNSALRGKGAVGCRFITFVLSNLHETISVYLSAVAQQESLTLRYEIFFD